MTEWGPSLTGPECIQLRLPDNILVCCCGVVRTASYWEYTSTSTEYALPANHPAYKVAEYNRNHPEAPMVYHGGTSLPLDWKPGNAVLYENGGVHSGLTDPRDIKWSAVIGYVPTPVEESRSVDHIEICHQCSGSGVGVADTICGNCDGSGGESDTVTLKRMTPGEFTIRYGLRDLTPIAVAVELGLTRLNKQFAHDCARVENAPRSAWPHNFGRANPKLRRYTTCHFSNHYTTVGKRVSGQRLD